MTDQVYTLGNLAMSCLNGAIALIDADYRPSTTCFRVGSEPPHDLGQFEDLCCRGFGYISLGDIWPSTSSFPESDIVRQANTACPPAAWGVDFKVALVTCVPIVGDTDLAPPTCLSWTEAYLKTLAHAEALRRVACCFRNAVQATPEFLGMSVVIGRQLQGALQGGCTERYVTLSVQMPNCDCLTI